MKKKRLSEREIDELVIAQVDEVAAWEEPIHVRPSHSTSIRLSADLIQRAKFFARLHGQKAYQSWLKQVIVERLEAEERMYRAIKSDLLTHDTGKSA